MKNIAIKLSLILTVIACTLSCTPEKTNDQDNKDNYTQFLEETQIGIYINNEPVKQFDPQVDQVVYNNSKSLYIVSTMDNKSSYTLSLNGRLYLDHGIEMEYNNKNIEKIGSGIISTKVLKVDASTLTYWLWNSELRIGFILKYKL